MIRRSSLLEPSILRSHPRAFWTIAVLAIACIFVPLTEYPLPDATGIRFAIVSCLALACGAAAIMALSELSARFDAKLASLERALAAAEAEAAAFEEQETIAASLKSLVDHAALAMFAQRVDGVILTWNPVAESMFGWKKTRFRRTHCRRGDHRRRHYGTQAR